MHQAHLVLWPGDSKDNSREAASRSDINHPDRTPISLACMLVQDWQQSKAVMDVPFNRLISISDCCKRL